MIKQLEYSENNRPIAVDIDGGDIIISLQDGRKLVLPLRWYPWLAEATPEQQADYELFLFSINWDCLNRKSS